MNKKLIHLSLLGSASALGINWIYDKELLEEFSTNRNVTFLPIQHELYDKAKHGYNVYPKHQLGDLDFMGEVIYHFHKFLEKGNGGFKEWRKYLYDKIGPESTYDGYLETYGKDLVKTINQTTFTSLVDKQLIASSMIIVGIAHNVDKETLLPYVKTLTAYHNIDQLYDSLHYVLTAINIAQKEEVLRKSVKMLPSEYQESTTAAFLELEVDEFIKSYSGVACGMDQSYPLIYYILHHTSRLKDAFELNASLGGASCARGILLGAVYSCIEEIPEEYKNILNYEI